MLRRQVELKYHLWRVSARQEGWRKDVFRIAATAPSGPASRLGFFAKRRRAGAWAYLNMPPITNPKKITTAAKSSPPTILFLMAPPRRAIGLLG
jgi:hypothetical protein